MLACWFKQLSLLKQIINLLETAICCFGYDLKNRDCYNVQPWFWSIFFWIEVASTIPNISLASRYDVASFLTYRVTCAGELVRVFYNECVSPHSCSSIWNSNYFESEIYKSAMQWFSCSCDYLHFLYVICVTSFDPAARCRRALYDSF